MTESPSEPIAYAVAGRPVGNAIGTAVGSEFAFSAGDFEQVRALIFQRAGISLNAGKQAMVYSRLSRRLRLAGDASFGDYLRRLRSASGEEAATEWQEFVNCLTTNLTAFFREDHHFVALAADLRQRAGAPLRIWCCAASTGEEPYSIAMTLLEALGPQQPARIIATDIDTGVLAQAQQAVYDASSRGLSPARLQRFFQRGRNGRAGLIRVKPEVARLVEFRPFNLIARPWPAFEPFDLVFCRNVMIYFNAETQRQVLQKLHRAMRPGGLLYVGHSENFTDSSQWFRLRGRTIYQRT